MIPDKQRAAEVQSQSPAGEIDLVGSGDQCGNDGNVLKPLGVEIVDDLGGSLLEFPYLSRNTAAALGEDAGQLAFSKGLFELGKHAAIVVAPGGRDASDPLHAGRDVPGQEVAGLPGEGTEPGIKLGGEIFVDHICTPVDIEQLVGGHIVNGPGSPGGDEQHILPVDMIGGEQSAAGGRDVLQAGGVHPHGVQDSGKSFFPLIIGKHIGFCIFHLNDALGKTILRDEKYVKYLIIAQNMITVNPKVVLADQINTAAGGDQSANVHQAGRSAAKKVLTFDRTRSTLDRVRFEAGKASTAIHLSCKGGDHSFKMSVRKKGTTMREHDRRLQSSTESERRVDR